MAAGRPFAAEAPQPEVPADMDPLANGVGGGEGTSGGAEG
jgi:hypothetical protein